MEPVCELKNKREGINSASAYVAVMDGDLQHDEQLLPHMLTCSGASPSIVVGSRYVAGGEIGEGLRASLTAGVWKTFGSTGDGSWFSVDTPNWGNCGVGSKQF